MSTTQQTEATMVCLGPELEDVTDALDILEETLADVITTTVYLHTRQEGYMEPRSLARHVMKQLSDQGLIVARVYSPDEYEEKYTNPSRAETGPF